MADRKPLSGSQPVHPAGAIESAAGPEEATLQATVVLKPEALPADHPVVQKAARQDRAWPTERPELTPAELEAFYAPSKQAVEEVLTFAGAHGLTVVEASSARHDVVLEGTISALDEAFQVTQRVYEHEGSSYRGHQGPIHVPETFHGDVVGILGLDSLSKSGPHLPAEAGFPAAPIAPDRIARHYRFPEVEMPGDARVALLEFGGGLWSDDVEAYLTAQGIPPREIRIFEVTDGGGACPGNRPCDPEVAMKIVADWQNGVSLAEIFKRYPDDAWSFYQSLEVTMDAEIVMALAGGVPVDLFFASGGTDGWRRAIFAASGYPYPDSISPPLSRTATDLPVALSISWGFQENRLQPMKLRVLHMALEFATRRGITVIASSGDRGSRMGGGAGDPLGVEFPASSPTVLACGGSALVPSGPGSLDEVAWCETLLGAPMASGGGMSGFFPIPGFQSALPTPDSSGTWLAQEGKPFSGRWVPDVSALASFSPGVELRIAGVPFGGGGTSAAAPIWAALVARLSVDLGQRLGNLSPALYRLAGTPGLRPIETGSNDLWPRKDGAPQYEAASGWDPCTGLGVPDGAALLEALRAGRT